MKEEQWFTNGEVTRPLLGRSSIKVNEKSNSEVVCITGPLMSGKSLLAGNFLLEGLCEGHDVLLVRFAENAGVGVDIKTCRCPGESQVAVFDIETAQ